MAYYAEANRDGNVDVVYPEYPLSGKEADATYENYEEIDVLEEFFDKIDLIIERGGCYGYGCAILSMYKILNSLEICGTKAHDIGEDYGDNTWWR